MSDDWPTVPPDMDPDNLDPEVVAELWQKWVDEDPNQPPRAVVSDSKKSGGRIEGPLRAFIDPFCTYYIPRRHLEEAGISLDAPSWLAFRSMLRTGRAAAACESVPVNPRRTHER